MSLAANVLNIKQLNYFCSCRQLMAKIRQQRLYSGTFLTSSHRRNGRLLRICTTTTYLMKKKVLDYFLRTRERLQRSLNTMKSSSYTKWHTLARKRLILFTWVMYNWPTRILIKLLKKAILMHFCPNRWCSTERVAMIV